MDENRERQKDISKTTELDIEAEESEEATESEREIGDPKSETTESGKKTDALNLRAEIYEWLSCVVSALIFCVITFVFFARVIGVVGDSMQPTLQPDDRLVISNLFYTPKRGDIIIFRKQSFRYDPLVKRVIATAGQVVDIDFSRGIVTVNGEQLDEDYIADLTRNKENFEGPITVPAGQLFVMGDNRNNSADSRDDRIGFIDERYVLGKVYFRVIPFGNFGSVYD